MAVIPPAFLFRFTLPVARVDRLPRAKSPQLALPENCGVPFPSLLEGDQPFARLKLAWNPHGLALEVEVEGKRHRPVCHPEDPATSDAVLIWSDTRDTQSQHRGSRFCHHFVAMPWGAGDDGRSPVIMQLPVPRAREDAPTADPDSFLVESAVSKTGYQIGIWLPAEALHGFDPVSQNRLGFYLVVQDRELGKQFLTVGEEFPYEADPSLWISLQLAD